MQRPIENIQPLLMMQNKPQFMPILKLGAAVLEFTCQIEFNVRILILPDSADNYVQMIINVT